MSKSRKLKRFVVKETYPNSGLGIGDVFTIEGEFIDRWFDPLLRRVYMYGRILKWYFYWKWRLGD